MTEHDQLLDPEPKRPSLGLDTARSRFGSDPLVSNSVQAAEATAMRGAPVLGRLLVDPGTPIAPHQLRVDELFALLRPALIAACNRELARVHRSANDCPYIVAWLGYYESKPAAHVERAITHYANGTASTARELVRLVVEAAVSSTRRWIETGEIEGIPGDVDPAIPSSAAGPVAKLGPGTPMPAAARAHVEQALGESFADVRLHDDARAHDAAAGVSARAFAVGPHVAFAAGEYQPETPEGAVMLAHELAHVAQSRETSGDVGSEDSAREDNANEVALAVATGTPARARKWSSLRLQRCSDKETPTPKPTPSPPPPAPHCTKPPVTVTMTGKMPWYGRIVDATQPSDVAGELACEKFELRDDFTVGGTTHKKGTVVLPTTWDNALLTAHVMIDGTTTEFDVPKWNLRPVRPTAPGIAPYGVDLETTSQNLAKKQAELDAWLARKGEFKKKPEAWEDQRKSLESQRDRYGKVVNELQIQQTMYNRFDAVILAAVNKANADRKLTGADKLDPNIVKAMAWHETEGGTSGPFLEDTSSGTDHRFINHYNITQAIDSYGYMYAVYFTEHDPVRAANFHVQDIIKDWKKTKRRKEILEERGSKRTGPENVELADLVTKSGPEDSWENYLRAYPGLDAAIDDLFADPGGGKPRLNMTYEHWIDMLIMELFEKKKSSADWSEAIRKYNGSGPDARAYRDNVLKRVKKALAAEKAGTLFTPHRKEKD